jgi:hypothetical protein
MRRDNSNLIFRIRAALYSLTREYGGGPLSIYTNLGTTTDLQSGVKTVNKSVTELDLVIILPAKINRDLIQTISQISANKAFVYGGSYDSRSRIFIVDRKHLTLDTLTLNDWLVYDGHKYEIKRIEEFSYDTAWVILARQVIDDTPEQIFPLAVDHRLSLDSSSENNE